MKTFRLQAIRLRDLVETYFDPINGWPKDPNVLNEEDVRLLVGGKRTWKLQYTFLEKLPSFVGLFVGNMVMAFLIHWVAWIVVLYVSFANIFPSDPLVTFSILTPIIFESILKKLLWGKIVSKDKGIVQPRMYAAMDVLLSLTSTITGPIKTVFRLAGGVICMFMHLFRSDVTMMLDRSFYALDPHFTSATGMLTALRVQYEFSKIRRHKDLQKSSGVPMLEAHPLAHPLGDIYTSVEATLQ